LLLLLWVQFSYSNSITNPFISLWLLHSRRYGGSPLSTSTFESWHLTGCVAHFALKMSLHIENRCSTAALDRMAVLNFRTVLHVM